MGQSFSVAEVAQQWGVHPRTVYREIERGALGCFYVGRAVRVTAEQLEAYIARQTKGQA